MASKKSNTFMRETADKHTGWIKLYRSLAESDLWKSDRFTKAQAWVDLIIGANHKKGSFWVRGIEVKLERGQIGWSQLTMSKRWGWSRGKVSRFIKWLENDSKIKQQTKQQITTIITLVNYEKYQSDNTTDKSTDGQQTDNRRNTNKNDKNEKKEYVSIEDLKIEEDSQ